MDYPGPSDMDLHNVQALNRAFLDCLRHARHRDELRDRCAVPLSELVAALNGKQLEHLASAPFLLFSLREQDAAYWERLLLAAEPDDLFDAGLSADDDLSRLLAAGLGFLWRLACSNPYTARIVSGATLHWCEQLADRTLVFLLQRAAARKDLLVPRFADNKSVWTRLLGAGVSSEVAIRRAARLSALQTMLTDARSSQSQDRRAAACRMPSPPAR